MEPLWQTKAELYSTYLKELPPDEVLVSHWLFDNVFDSMNISLFTPKKDKCDTCVQYEKKLLSQEQYDEHRTQVNKAREEKKSDKEGLYKVFALDKQAILLCLKNNSSSMFYKSKLSVHNYTVLDLKTHQGYCYL